MTLVHRLVEGHRHVARVLAHPHEGEAEDDLALAVGGRAAAADGVADGDLGDVADADRHAVVGLDDDVGDLLDGRGPADPLDQARLARPDDVAAADVLVVLPRGPAMTSSSVRPYLASFIGSACDLELLGEAAPGVDLGDPGHADEAGADDPILERAQLGQVDIGVTAREEVVVDLAQPGGDRPHRRPLDALRELRLAEPLVDLLAGEVDVGPVLEDGDDLREAELRDRADLLEPLQAPQRVLDGEGDEPLDLLGRQLGGDGVDLDLDRRRVGERVERQVDRRADAEDDEERGRARRTTKRFFRLNSIRALSMVGAPSLGCGLVAATGPDGALHDFGLEQERAVGDDLSGRASVPR